MCTRDRGLFIVLLHLVTTPRVHACSRIACARHACARAHAHSYTHLRTQIVVPIHTYARRLWGLYTPTHTDCGAYTHLRTQIVGAIHTYARRLWGPRASTAGPLQAAPPPPFPPLSYSAPLDPPQRSMTSQHPPRACRPLLGGTVPFLRRPLLVYGHGPARFLVSARTKSRRSSWSPALQQPPDTPKSRPARDANSL